jgi:DNA-binding transcriptional LysR family regulator
MAPVLMEWEARLGRRLRVRDLYILATVVKTGGMAKAARELAMTQPAVSSAIANLEHLLGVRLLDRSPRGIEPTIYATAMLKRSRAVFDELMQSVKDVGTLADPATGELRIGSNESTSATLLPRFLEPFLKKYPRVLVRVHDLPPPAVEHPGLRDREFDLVFGRRPPSQSNERATHDLNLETLFEDPLIVAAGANSRWVGRRKIDLAELVKEPWILPPPNSWNYIRIAEACRLQNLDMPTVHLSSFSMDLANHFVANSPFITAQPKSIAQLLGMKVLPVKLPVRPWLVIMATLKNRTLSPLVERFMECTREVAKGLARRSGDLRRS